MPQIVRVAILRGKVSNPRPPGAAASPALPTDQGILEAIVHNPRHDAVFDYWETVTDGNLQFEGHTLFPWVEVSFDAADIDYDANAGVSRINGFKQRDKIMAATRARPGGPASFADFDFVLVLSYPGDTIVNPAFGLPDKPHTPHAAYDGGERAGVIAPYASATHSFLCHEIGHKLGLADAHGILANANLPATGNYANPYDIMGAEAWGGSQPAFSGAPFPGWFATEFARRMGPAPSLAVLHHLDPAHVLASDVKELVVADNSPTLRLFAAQGKRGRTRLVAVRRPLETADHFGRVYLEYRDTQGWDRGLDTTGADLARRAVVAHVVIPAPVSVPPRMQPCYRGRVLIPREVDADLDIPHSPYTVRVLDEDQAGQFVDLQVTRSAPARLDLLSDVVERRGAQIGMGGQERTPCGDTIHWLIFATTTRMSLRPVSWGQGGAGGPGYAPGPAPVVSWEIGGSALALQSGSGLHACVVDGATVHLRIRRDAATQTLEIGSPAGIRCRLPVQCTVSSASGGPVLSASAEFAAPGSVRRLPAEDLRILTRCEAGQLAKLLREKRKPGFPKGPGPVQIWRSRTGREALINYLRQQPTPALRQSAEALTQLAAIRAKQLQR